MRPSHTLTLGLAPALTVEETVHFGPLTLMPVGESGEDAFREVAARFADERGAHPECQTIVTCTQDLRPVLITVWPLFVFACVTYARRWKPPTRGVAFPENFHLLSITSTKDGWTFNSGHNFGIGDVKHLPLRWPVDWPTTLREGWWDRRIELACTLLAREPGITASTMAAGMAADLACAAIERRNQKVQNVAAGARNYVLLGAAFEALHCRGSDVRHSHAEVIKGVSRLNPASTSLGEMVFSEAGIQRPPKPEPGTAAARPMFAVAQLVHMRNTYAHGRVPSESDFTLPAELNGCHLMDAAMLILAALVGDDLSRDLSCVVPGGIREMMAVQERLDLPFGLVQAALTDGRNLLDRLVEAIVPARG